MTSRSANRTRLDQFLQNNPIISAYMRECSSTYQIITDTEYSDQFKIDQLMRDIEHMQRCINDMMTHYGKDQNQEKSK